MPAIHDPEARSTAIATATRYLDALISHEADTVPLAPDARRIDNGKVVVEGADALRAIIRREPAAATSSFRWLVADDATQAVVFYDLDADMGGDPRGAGEGTDPIPAYIGERFRIADDLIEEIEVVYTARVGHPRPPRPERYPVTEVEPAAVMAASQAYVAALLSHDAADVPLASGVWRIENGQVTADNADGLRTSLESEIMHTVHAIDDERWFVDAGVGSAAVFYTLTARIGGTAEEPETMAVRIAERFRVVAGELAEIEAVFAPVPADR